MPLNHKEISLILSELELEGYWIQKITQGAYFSLTLHLYKEQSLSLYINMQREEPLLYKTSQKMPKEEKTMRFLSLLRSRIVGAKIEEACQLEQNRIVRLKLAKQENVFYLYIKLWSNACNMFLCDANNIIIDVFYRRQKAKEVQGCEFIYPKKKEDKREFEVRDYDKSLSFNEAIEKEYTKSEKTLSRAMLLEESKRFFANKINKIRALMANLKEKEASFANSENLKCKGDLITSNIHKIARNTKNVRLLNYYSGEEIDIELDPHKSPQENAQSYYERYKKAVTGAKKVKGGLERCQKDIDEIERVCSIICEEPNVIIMFKLLQKAKKDEGDFSKSKDHRIGLSFFVHGWNILVGRSSKENDVLLRKHAKGNDVWLHTRDVSGGFVFIKSKGINKTVPLDVLIAAGNLAVYYSKARKAGEANLYKTYVKNLRRVKGGKQGQVLVYHEKNLFIRLNSSIIESLKN